MSAGLIDAAIVATSVGLIKWALLDRMEPALELGALLYCVYHAGFYWLMDGQTPGLASLEIRLVSEQGKALSVLQALLRGVFRPALVCALGWAAWESTQKPGMAAFFALLVLPIEIGMMFTLPSRQTLSDLVARTLAVEAQPPEALLPREGTATSTPLSAPAAGDSPARVA